MTHSLHRRGTDESLKNDYVLLITAASGINHEGSKEMFSKILDIVWEVGPDNIGSNETGTILSGVTVEEIRAGFTNVPRVRCNYASKEKVREAIKRLKELDAGYSVTVSGPTGDILEMCKEFGIKPHSVNFSLDIWGKKELLPSEEILELLTMCGHGLISQQLVKETIEKVKSGKMTPKKAAEKIGHPCVCGIYNPVRAEELLQKYVPNK
ncbi:MAG TPA: hypothetical protein GXX46_07855 [Peptococcaceae bacterium]|nr:hypothetical protein [Peptococcaceae bacterium]